MPQRNTIIQHTSLSSIGSKAHIQVEDGSYLLRPQTTWNLRINDVDISDPWDFSHLKLEPCWPLPQFYAEFSSPWGPSWICRHLWLKTSPALLFRGTLLWENPPPPLPTPTIFSLLAVSNPSFPLPFLAGLCHLPRGKSRFQVIILWPLQNWEGHCWCSGVLFMFLVSFL